MIAKKKGTVRFSDIKNKIEELHGCYKYNNADGFNTSSAMNRITKTGLSMADYIRNQWNNPNGGRSPYKYFGGILIPIGVDENRDVIYKYNAMAVNSRRTDLICQENII